MIVIIHSELCLTTARSSIYTNNIHRRTTIKIIHKYHEIVNLNDFNCCFCLPAYEEFSNENQLKSQYT